MGLEKIEVENFKSYAGCHTIGPFDKFTCVVGPNGSGKSNIMDAIAFALGYSSLRTSTATSLIHKGCTETSVKIYINQHTFKRHLLGSGRSTYFADGKLVKFEVYFQALSSLGLNLKLRNFMVFQGDVHNIKSPKELAEYFEVLSGSIEYKKEYEEVSAKLCKELAECGILYEQKKNVLMVMKEDQEEKRQMDLFKECLEKKNRLESEILNLEVGDLKEKVHQANSDLQVLQVQQEDFKKEVKACEDSLLKKKEEVGQVRNEYSELEQNLQDLRVRKMGQIREMAEVYKSKDRANIRKKEVAKEISDNLKRIEELQEEVYKEKRDLKSLEEGYSRILKMREVNQAKFGFTKEQEEVYLENTKEIREKKEKLQLEISRKEKILQNVNRKKLARSKEVERDNQKIQSLQANVDLLRRNVDEIKSGEDLKKYEELVRLEEGLNEKISETVSALLRIRATKKINIKKETKRTVVNTLKGIFPGVHGLLIDLVRPIEKKYYSPILTILQSLDYAVVVDSDTTALTCINYIKEKKLCRLTFLPLRGSKGIANLVNEERFRSALLCVSYEDRFSRAVEMALGDSLIADTKEVALDLVYSKGVKANVCALDNFFIQSQGRIISTSPVQDQDQDMFGRLVEERKRILREIKAVQDKKSRMSKIEIVKERLKVYEDKIDQDLALIQEISTKVYPEIEEEVEDFPGINFPGINFPGISQELEDLKGLLKEEEIKIFGRVFGDSSYEEFKDNLKDLEYASLKTRMEKRIKTCEEEMEDLRNQIKDLEEDSRKESQVQALDPEVESEIRRLDFLVEKKKASLETYLGDLDILNGQYKEACGSLKNLNSNLLSLESLKTRLEEEIEEKERFAKMEEIPLVGLDLEGKDLPRLREDLTVVNKKINEMVPSVRTGQKDLNYEKILKDYDLAKGKAMETRKRMNEIKRLRLAAFMQCFERVSSEIGKIYQEITGGEVNARGNAYLVLDNPSEPYLEGVRYHIMPPSKRFREISFLSGGEKSMAILALMFAIHRYRPVPFFVLDEFDSALDKANVGRLVDFFVRSEVQFLVISLKPILFQYSDSLVGVYKDPVDSSSRLLTYRL